jgi:hypothetical protein
VKAGKLTLPSLAILDATGKLIAKTQPWEIEVKSAIPSTDPKPTEPVPPVPPLGLAFPTWALITLLTLGGVVLCVGIFYLWRYWVRRRSLINVIPETPKTEDEIALATLLDFEKRKLWESAKFKPHYFGISETLKTYLGARYGFEAPEMTSAEVVQKLREVSPISEDLRRSLQGLFEKLDQVKFTDITPREGEPQKVLESAREFVQITRRPKLILEENHAPRG